MAGPRTPTAVLDARGAFKRHPERARARAGEPAPNGPIGDAPASLTEVQRAAWDEIVSCCPPGVLCRADRIMVRMAACLLAEFDRFPADFSAARFSRLETILGKFGMSPADRSKVTAAQEEEENPFAKFVA